MLKKYFIPHQGNNHQPHLLRKRAVLAVLVFLFFIEAAFLVQILVVWPMTGIFSSVLPNVLVDLTNNSRAQNKIVSLSVNPLLEQAALLKAQDMAAKSYFAHTSPEGVSPWHWLQKIGYQYSGAGENLAINFSDSAEIVNAWMNSSGHRANILDDRFSEIGIATAKGIYQGKETIFVVEFFGRPALASNSSNPQVAGTPATTSARPSVPQKPVLSSSPSGAAPEETLLVGRETASGTVSGVLEINAAVQAATRTNFWQRLLSMPKTLTAIIYIVIAAIFSTALALKIFVKIKIQYPKLIFNGAVVLFVVISLLYLNNLIAGGGQSLPPVFIFN